jgi:hypothetical protein
VGVEAGRENSSACLNSFFGACAGVCGTTGGCNTFLGALSGACNTTGGRNTFAGYCAGHCNTTGSTNTFIGTYAGRCNTTGCNNLFAGTCAGHGTFGLINTTTESNRIILGNADISNFYTKMAAKAWACTTVKWDSTTYEMAADTSSRRFKTNIRPFLGSIPDVLKIESVRYKPFESPDANDQVGFIAEQLDEICLKEFIAYDKDNTPFSVSYDRITALLVNAIKDLTEELESVKARLSLLENK